MNTEMLKVIYTQATNITAGYNKQLIGCKAQLTAKP